MYHFTYWLEHFKELPPAKVQTIVKNTNSLAEKTATACTTTGKLTDSKTLAAFYRARQAIIRVYGADLSPTEKKALALYGEYWEFREYSNFKFPEESESLLLDYCKSMQMSYSYKAVLIYELIKNNCTETPIEQLVNSIIAFYQDRLDHSLIAEKKDSVFSKKMVSFEEAKKVIVANPVRVFVDAKIIAWNKQTGMVSVTSDYLPRTEEARNEVCMVCLDRLEKYYSSICLESTSSKIAEKELAVTSQTQGELLSHDDLRKVGALVQDSIALLEKNEFKFTPDQLSNMTSLEWSKTVLKLNYPFFKIVEDNTPVEKQRLDHLGNSRYYSRVFAFSGKKYLVTSQWYAKSKPLFIEWYNALAVR